MRALQTVATRELLSVVRSRATLVLLAGVSLVIGGVLLASGNQSYLPASVDLLLPMEFLVPAVAIALGYRTVTADARRGELDVLETYPVSPKAYIGGVYLGRALSLVVIIGIPLVVAWAYLAASSPDDLRTFATHSGVDSPLVFLRFIVLTLAFALSVLGMTIAVSAVAGSRRTALVFGVVLFALVVLALDLLIVRGFASGVIPEAQLRTVLAVSPTSAYRGLVFETVIATATETDLQQASPIVSFVSLIGWTVGSLAVAIAAVKRR